MESTLSVINGDGSPAGDFSLDPGCLEMEKGEQAVHDAVVSFLSKHRAGTASAKTRGEVRGSGGKPYRQKGTGRARAGSVKSPIWRGGGVVFGPKPRSFTKNINSKVRKLALKRAFSERVAADDVIVVENIALEDHKTKSMLRFLATIQAGEDALVVVDDIDENLELASGNLPDVEVMEASSVNPYWLLLFKKIIFTRESLNSFTARLQSVKREARK